MGGGGGGHVLRSLLSPLSFIGLFTASFKLGFLKGRRLGGPQAPSFPQRRAEWGQ